MFYTLKLNDVYIHGLIGIAVSQDLKQDLLELLCFYNSEQPPSEDYYEVN